MAGTDALAIIAEVSLGLAGFTGVVVVLGRVERDAFLRLRLSYLLSVSFSALFLALLPFALSELSLSTSQVWLFASLLLVACGLAIAVGHTPAIRRNRREHPGILGPATLVTGYGLTLAASLSGMIGLAIASERVGAYLAGLIFLVCQAIFMFIRILFTHPQGRSAD